MAIEVPADTRRQLVESIKRYFAEEMDEEIGELRASLLLDFCLREIGSIVYNIAISDAQTYIQDKVADIDGSCYEPEFGYWNR